jgi:hypothetical protein
LHTEQSTRLGKRDDKGISLREHLEVAKASGADPKELRELVELGDYTRRLWGIFLNLRNSTTPGFSGPVPINHQTTRAYTLNTGVKINKRELVVLTLMDSKYLEVVNG